MFSNLSKEQGAFAHLIVGRYFFHGDVVMWRWVGVYPELFPFQEEIK